MHLRQGNGYEIFETFQTQEYVAGGWNKACGPMTFKTGVLYS